VLARAWRLLDGDPRAAVLKLYPKAIPDAEAAEGWGGRQYPEGLAPGLVGRTPSAAVAASPSHSTGN
jgi:hypothetical protein